MIEPLSMIFLKFLILLIYIFIKNQSHTILTLCSQLVVPHDYVISVFKELNWIHACDVFGRYITSTTLDYVTRHEGVRLYYHIFLEINIWDCKLYQHFHSGYNNIVLLKIWNFYIYHYAYSTKQTFLPWFLVILRHPLQNHWKTVKNCSLLLVVVSSHEQVARIFSSFYARFAQVIILKKSS